MSTRITAPGPAREVTETTTAPRVTPPPARPFKAVLDTGSAAVVASAETAARKLPGGPIIAAALRTTSTSGVPTATTAAPEGSAGTAGAGVGGEGAGLEQSLVDNEDKTLYYLELQQRIANETNAYSALSNVMKARHDTIKNAIGNIR